MSSSRMPATWFLTEALFLITLSLICALAFAQTNTPTTGEPSRGNTPPGVSQDGARPADGAIKGGAPAAAGGSSDAKKRCDEMIGSLRDECLEKDRSNAATPRDPHQVLKKPY
jgi:hypothetical protein